MLASGASCSRRFILYHFVTAAFAVQSLLQDAWRFADATQLVTATQFALLPSRQQIPAILCVTSAAQVEPARQPIGETMFTDLDGLEVT